MRIISQDGMVDLPYDNIAVWINYKNKKHICADGININTGLPYTVAKYSTEEKAMYAMRMLIEEYKSRRIICFRFPQDNEIGG